MSAHLPCSARLTRKPLRGAVSGNCGRARVRGGGDGRKRFRAPSFAGEVALRQVWYTYTEMGLRALP